MADGYRETARIPLRPVFTSLGLPVDAFTALPGGRLTAPFDAGVNCGPAAPDCLWLFRGGDAFRYDLRAQAMVEGPVPIAAWGGPTWPAAFATGIDAAVWGGPAYPHLHYFFKENLVIRRNTKAGGIDVQPTDMVAVGFGSVAGTPLARRIEVAFHDVRPSLSAKLHLVGPGGRYARHDLNTGRGVDAPQTFAEVFKVPEPFASGADVAFFGVGQEAETLFLMKDLICCTYDLAADKASATTSIDALFPGMRPWIPRPQLFLVEDYVLGTYCGEPMRGEHVDNLTVGPRTRKKVILVTERTTERNAATAQNILQSQQDEVAQNLYDRLSDEQRQGGGSESYRYHMDAKAHGEAQAKGVWGGEVDATVNVAGGSDQTRQEFAGALLSSVEKQVKSSNTQITQRQVSSMEEVRERERVLSTQEEEVDNSMSDRPLVVEYFQSIQPYLTVLALTRVRIAFGDGKGAFDLRPVHELGPLLERTVTDAATRRAVTDFVRASLTSITDHDGQPVSLLVEGGDAVLRLRPAFSTDYAFVREDGTRQTVSVPGVVVAAERHLVRTPTLFARKRED